MKFRQVRNPTDSLSLCDSGKTFPFLAGQLKKEFLIRSCSLHVTEMSKKCEYNVNGNPPPKDTSFRSFICALLVFLALCLAIYLVLTLVNFKGSKGEKEETEVVKKSDKLTAFNVPDDKKEYVDTTEAWTGKDIEEKPTERTSTAGITYKTTSTLGNDVDNIPATVSTTRSFETTTKSPQFKDEDKSTISWSGHDIDKVPGTISTQGTFETTTKLSQFKDEDASTVNWSGHDLDKVGTISTQGTFETTTKSSQFKDEDASTVSWSEHDVGKVPGKISTQGTFETTTKSSQFKDEDASTLSWRNVIIINESTKKSEEELTTSYKDEDNGSTTNVPYVTDNDQNTSDILTEGINKGNKGTSREFILEGVIDQSTDESTTTENDAYLTTTESIYTGINDTLFYRDVIATEVTKNIKESTTTAVPPLPTTSIYTSHPTYYGNYRYPSFSTTEDENSSTEESTSENILSTARIPLLRSLSGSPYSTGTTDTANLESITNTFRKIHYKGDTTERITTGGTFGTENDSSTTDLFRSTTKSGRLTRTTDAYHKNNYADSTTEDTTSASEMKSTYNEYDTTDVQEATGDYQRSNYKYASNLLTKDITTESWDSSTETETVSILNMTYTQTTTSVPLTTTERKNPFTSQPMKATTPPSAPQACASKVCKNTASKLLYLMNHDDDDSCENFFDFACGGQKIDEEYPKRKNLKMLINYLDRINGSAHKYLRDFKTFYGSCVKHEQSFKFMPRLEFLITSPNMSLTELFAELILTQSMPLFDIGVDNKMDSYIFEITLPGKSSLKNSVQGWSLMDQIRKECLDTLKLSKRKPEINLDKEYSSLQICQRERFKNIAEDFVEEIKRFLDYSPVFNETNLENLLSVMDWIQRSLPEEYDIQQTLIDKDYGMSSIEGLKSAIDSSFVEWEAIFRKITFQGASDRTLIVYFKNYLESLFKMLTNKFNKWELFDMLWLYSRLQLYVNTVVSKEREDREMYCMDLAKQIMPNTVSVITYKVTGDQTFATYKVQSFFEKLKQKLTESIQNSKLEDATKDMLQERLKKVSLGMITTGDHTAAINNNQVLTLTENDYQANVVESLRNYRRIVYSLAGTEATPASLLRYFVDPFSTRPKLFEARNVIVAQAAFIKKYALRVPKHISFATIGMHLSRELANVVTNGTIREKQYYQDLMTYTKDLLIIYANYTYNVQGSTVFFNITQNLWINQMIVDNTAFKLTLNCFNELGGFDKPNVSSLPWMVSDYPVNKEFFIAAAQEYCREYAPLDFMEDLYVTGNLPPPLRVQNFLSNSEEFATVFNCAEGSPMAVQKEMIAQFPNLDYSYDYSGISN